ncbi:MAG: D-alanyl-D-alanine carboxypeptidase family protein [Enterocloster sp.]
MKRLICFGLSMIMTMALTGLSAFAKPDWPADTGVQSEAAIVMDMDSGTVLFAQNIHEQKAPASIVKLLTALVVIENGDLESEVTFSHDAVYNVEEGSGNKLQIEEGDVLSVRNCLYLLLLQSSNQAANALAEHVAGSRQAFVDMMNQKAQELGCQESHFANPSGLNDETQFTSAYDMALIARAAFNNSQLLEIDTTKEIKLPSTINNPNGRTCYMEHKMLVTDDPTDENYYPYAVAGKTGYTSIAGQTLVTYARKEDRGQIAVTLKSSQRTHYTDTKTIMEFGFARFKNMNVAENEIQYVTGQETVSIGGEVYEPSELYYDSEAVITLPKESEFSDAEKNFSEDLSGDHPQGAVGKMTYTYNDRKIGEAWLYSRRQSAEETAKEATPGQPVHDAENGTPSQETGGPGRPSSGMKIPPRVVACVGIGAAVIVFAAGGICWFKRQQALEAERRRIMREKRLKRLADIGCSEEEFERLLNERRQSLSNRHDYPDENVTDGSDHDTEE